MEVGNLARSWKEKILSHVLIQRLQVSKAKGLASLLRLGSSIGLGSQVGGGGTSAEESSEHRLKEGVEENLGATAI